MRAFMKNEIIVYIFLLFMFSAASASGADFKGNVIDAETKEPIEGAVVVAYWHEERAEIPGPNTRLKDVKETLTDKNGEWMIKGPGGSSHSNIKALFTFITRTYYTRRPNFIFYKPGYCPWPDGFSIEACKVKLKPSGNPKIREGQTVELPRLTKREDRRRANLDPVGDKKDWKKQKLFIQIIREEWQFITSKDPGDLYMWEDTDEK